jgi:uncharacterized protein YbjQ (UPF0145 family)
VARRDEAAIARAQAIEAARAVLVTTGDLQAKYQPVNIVFAVGGSAGGLFKTASPQEAFENARYQLQLAAAALGGNGVVFCRFGYSQHAQQGGCGGSSVTVHGYGTVVRFS